jgi:hypothetical protein
LGDPPEVLFHRYFQQREPHRAPVRPEDPDPRVYRGKHSLNGLPPEVQSFFVRLQDGFTTALCNEKQGVPEHVEHPPFHLDYIDSDIQNALAFQYEGIRFHWDHAPAHPCHCGRVLSIEQVSDDRQYARTRLAGR